MIGTGRKNNNSIDTEVVRKSSHRGATDKGICLDKVMIFLAIASLCSAWLIWSTSQVSLQLGSRIRNREGDTDEISRAVGDVGGFIKGQHNQTKDIVSRTSPKGITTVKAKATIAYAISLTGCAGDGGGAAHRQFASVGLFDGPAVLKHSIHMNSIRVKPNATKYDYHMIAIVHPDASDCFDGLANLGYEIVIRDTPVDITKIEGDFLRTHVNKTGCCGEKEFLKLWTYTFDKYPIVVHLDMDSVLFQPFDNIFDAMLEEPLAYPSEAEDQAKLPYRQSLEACNNTALPPPHQPIKAMFTRDYYMIHPGKQHVGMQGGFLVVKPDLEVFEEYKSVILKGDFVSGKGWGGKYGGYFGAQQIQGLVAYYYDGLHPLEAVELEYCIYNNMGQNIFDETRNACRGPRGMVCTDCKNVPFHTVKSGHFTVCNKPWKCGYQTKKDEICYHMTREWFRLRYDLESRLSTTGENDNTEVQIDSNPEYQVAATPSATTGTSLFNHRCSGAFGTDQFHGCCSSRGSNGYIPLSQKF